ncbi:MAG: hypothetical protein M3Y72_13155 [Acidobacteriota bacterium]|nr:hypothetical protein [Acidobacteriota bacterium]
MKTLLREMAVYFKVVAPAVPADLAQIIEQEDEREARLRKGIWVKCVGLPPSYQFVFRTSSKERR